MCRVVGSNKKDHQPLNNAINPPRKATPRDGAKVLQFSQLQRTQLCLTVLFFKKEKEKRK
jgi:hypothetical protein